MSDETPTSARNSIALNLALAVDRIGLLTSEVTGLRQEFRDWKKENKEDLAALRQEFKEELDGYVTKDAFDPVRMIAYGLTGTVGLGVISAVLYLITHITP